MYQQTFPTRRRRRRFTVKPRKASHHGWTVMATLLVSLALMLGMWKLCLAFLLLRALRKRLRKRREILVAVRKTWMGSEWQGGVRRSWQRVVRHGWVRTGSTVKESSATVGNG